MLSAEELQKKVNDDLAGKFMKLLKEKKKEAGVGSGLNQGIFGKIKLPNMGMEGKSPLFQGLNLNSLLKPTSKNVLSPITPKTNILGALSPPKNVLNPIITPKNVMSSIL